jgi:UDP-glucose:(heptosyl)LPS alpha-1,3-glucosyltransferase
MFTESPFNETPERIKLATTRNAIVEAPRMKLGLVRRGYSGTGGAESYVRRFAEAVQEAGHECVLFSSAEWKDAPWEGQRVTVDGETPRDFADSLRQLDPRRHCDFLFSLERVWECDAYRAGDGVHASWLERRARYEKPWRAFARKFQRKHREILSLERALFTRGAKLIIANSAMVRREITQYYRTPPERIEVVHNGVPAFIDDPELRLMQRKEFRLNQNDYCLLFAGSGWERKGLGYAIEALRHLPNTFLFVAGEGKRRGLPRSDRVHFLGAQNREGMNALLSAADAFVLPTIYEPFSNACLEALAAGVPVITTAANGFSEILSVSEGEIISEPSNVAALATAIDAWSDPAKRVGARPQLREKGARYSIEANVEQTLKLITGMMEERSQKTEVRNQTPA